MIEDGKNQKNLREQKTSFDNIIINDSNSHIDK